MKLLRKLPSDRSYEQIKNHYLVEKGIATRIKLATPDKRKEIYATMYEELFEKVPDHPRLTRRNSKELTRIALATKLALLKGLLDKTKVFAEFAPGDCKFSIEMAKYYEHVYAIDISDQRDRSECSPANFKLIIYDGYHLHDIAEKSIDVMFSDQLIEHFHPEETKAHFELVSRLLKAGGSYVFCTPHAYSGPQDVSMYFSYEAEGFHLKEWTYREVRELLKDSEYSKLNAYWFARGMRIPVPYALFLVTERILGVFPKRWYRPIARYVLPSVCIVAHK